MLKTLYGTLDILYPFLIMTYIGSDGALDIINFYYSTAIVAVLAIMFYVIGVSSRLKE